MHVVHRIRFDGDDRRTFAGIASPSILADDDDETPRLRAVRRAARTGEDWSHEQLLGLAQQLHEAILYRENVIVPALAGHAHVAESAAQWLDPLREARSLATLAAASVNADPQGDDA